MPYLTQLADVARRTGFPVVEEAGWRSRGHGSMSQVRSVIAHHDAANHRPNQFNTVIRDGHSTLAGPLSHYAIRRDGTIHVVAAGLCYHAGTNNNGALYNNQYSIGIEAANRGTGEPWPRVQLDAYEALCAALCREFGLGPERVRGHREIAPTRKIDPAGIDMNWFRSAVARRMAGGGGSGPTPAPTPVRKLEVANTQLYAPSGAGTHRAAGDLPSWDDLSEAYLSVGFRYGGVGRLDIYVIGPDGVSRRAHVTGYRLNNGAWFDASKHTIPMSFANGMAGDHRLLYGLERHAQGVAVDWSTDFATCTPAIHLISREN